MLIDSHCHLNFDELYNNLDDYLQQMKDNQISHALCVGTKHENWSRIIQIAAGHDNIFASVGLHPGEFPGCVGVTAADILQNADHPKVVAIGETGLDYYRVETKSDIKWQHERFILHIEAAKEKQLPLIIHTRNSIEDTLAILKENYVSDTGVVMHCFTEDVESAKKCLEMGFYISISGIVTFKNAVSVQEMAKYVPLDRLLVETDAPFLAPAPFRGKLNHPALVKFTAQYMADMHGLSLEKIAEATTANFFKLFKKAGKFI